MQLMILIVCTANSASLASFCHAPHEQSHFGQWKIAGIVKSVHPLCNCNEFPPASEWLTAKSTFWMLLKKDITSQCKTKKLIQLQRMDNFLLIGNGNLDSNVIVCFCKMCTCTSHFNWKFAQWLKFTSEIFCAQVFFKRLSKTVLKFLKLSFHQMLPFWNLLQMWKMPHLISQIWETAQSHISKTKLILFSCSYVHKFSYCTLPSYVSFGTFAIAESIVQRATAKSF